MQTLRTDRLLLIPCSLDMAKSIVDSRNVGGYKKVESWPSQDIKDFFPYYIESLQNDSSLVGWGVWLMVHSGQGQIIGDLGFKGKPDKNGAVEIGYGIAPEYRRQGYTFEAAKSLVKWAFDQILVNKVIAECTEDNIPSVHLLQRLGMKKINSINGILHWELGKVSGE